jgi:hypothetical protein
MVKDGEKERERESERAREREREREREKERERACVRCCYANNTSVQPFSLHDPALSLDKYTQQQLE